MLIWVLLGKWMVWSILNVFVFSIIKVFLFLGCVIIVKYLLVGEILIFVNLFVLLKFWILSNLDLVLVVKLSSK